MNKSFLARSLHKWIGLFVGVQVLIWLGTGLYMVVLDLDFIHGDPLVKNSPQTLTVPESGLISIASLRQQYPKATSIGLRPIMGNTFFTVSVGGNRHLLDPQSGEVVSPLDKKTATEIAVFHFNGDGPVRNVELITENPPSEIGARPLPIWRIDFDDWYNTSFYINPDTGALSTRRHTYWRLFDIFFMLHIMDYTERTDAHNLLLKVAQFTGTGFAITGLWLLFYSFKRRRKTVVK